MKKSTEKHEKVKVEAPEVEVKEVSVSDRLVKLEGLVEKIVLKLNQVPQCGEKI